ncbi:hypothetical protein [Flavobacterium hydatis]|uniref:Uncharacterized protein n=1 Tax=Flavobacterium hydatis TaxID=991 RepID=A0A086AP00_FLAHY|nr:hypothetical protein [Flavobacterium hydatis]KFF18414.1 hypothetical protein IW20_05825 [Flavobacterium hydatis]OXA96838.1 hypothetical protein B0A62_06190 [Flavobacterium hydatis]
MEVKEVDKPEDFRQLIARYFTTIKPTNDKVGIYTAEIRVSNYCELSCVISNMLKLCILALDHEAVGISKTTKDSSIDIALILKIVTQLLPMDEIEFLDEINKMVVRDSLH